MKLPIDTTGMTFLAAGSPEPVRDFDSKAAKVDENGEAIFAVQVVVLANGGAEVISVKVAGEPKGPRLNNLSTCGCGRKLAAWPSTRRCWLASSSVCCLISTNGSVGCGWRWRPTPWAVVG